MEVYNKEMSDLKELVAKALESKGALAKIRAQVRASIFEVIEDQDKNAPDGAPKSVVGRCLERAKSYHATRNGQLLIALLEEYFEWAELDHTSKVYHSECDIKSELPQRFKLEEELGLSSLSQKEGFSSNGAQSSSTVNSGEPLLGKLLDAYLSGKTSQSASVKAVPAPDSTHPQSQNPTKSSTAARNIRSNSPTVRRESMGATIMRNISPARHRMVLPNLGKNLIPGSNRAQQK